MSEPKPTYNIRQIADSPKQTVEQLLNVQQLPAVFWDNTQDGYPLPGDIEIDADNGGNALIEIHQPGRGLYVVFNEGDLEILLAKIRNA